MSNRLPVMIRLIGICILGVAASLLANRFGYVIPLACAYEIAARATPDCTSYKMSTENGFFTIDDGHCCDR